MNSNLIMPDFPDNIGIRLARLNFFLLRPDVYRTNTFHCVRPNVYIKKKLNSLNHYELLLPSPLADVTALKIQCQTVSDLKYVKLEIKPCGFKSRIRGVCS